MVAGASVEAAWISVTTTTDWEVEVGAGASIEAAWVSVTTTTDWESKIAAGAGAAGDLDHP